MSTFVHSTPGAVSSQPPTTLSTAEIEERRDVRKIAGRLLTLIDACFRGEPEQLKAIKDMVKQELCDGGIYYPPTESLVAGVSLIPDYIHGTTVENPAGRGVMFYGPQQCGECGRMIVMSGWEFGSVRYDQPEGTIYPNTQWLLHRCDGGKRSS